MSNKVILADNGNARMEADTILKKRAQFEKPEEYRVNIFLTKTFGIIIMIGIFVSMVACGGGGNNIEGTYVNVEYGYEVTFSGNTFKFKNEGRYRLDYEEGTYELLVEHKKGKNSRGFIIFIADGRREQMPYVLEGNRLTIGEDLGVWIKK